MTIPTNFWNQFNDLLPKSPVLKGRVLSSVVSGGGLYDVELISGGVVRVSSTTDFPVETSVFIKDGVITGKAPELDSSILEI